MAALILADVTAAQHSRTPGTHCGSRDERGRISAGLPGVLVKSSCKREKVGGLSPGAQDGRAGLPRSVVESGHVHLPFCTVPAV